MARIGLLLLAPLAIPAATRADDPTPPESALVRLLKSGRVPEERQPQILAKIGQLGSAADLAFLFDHALDPKGFSPANRARALDALAEAALTRKGMKPRGDVARLARLLARDSDPSARLAAVRLAGLWKAESLVPALAEVAAEEKADDALRGAALESLAQVGPAARPAIDALTATDRPVPVRLLAIAALAKLDPNAAAQKAALLIRTAPKDQDLAHLVAAFVNRQEGPALLASAIEAAKVPADNAKLALRAVYALGRADAPLVAALSRAAGIESETKPPTKEEMDRLVADVNANGDAARGERVFRRADLNCMKCHSIAGAAGGVGPDLSSVGLSSPVDYVINSVLVPDMAIKEQYHTLVVATADGQVFQGIVADRDDKRIVLREATGDLRTVPASDIEESKEGGSLMPKGLANLLTRAEFVDLVRFLSELGRPGGPYAIRNTPTIQRWRIMTPVPDELARSVLDPGAFVSRVRDSAPSLWAPAYALATGALPLDEFAAKAGSPVLYLRGEIDVSAAGPLAFAFGSASGVRAWIDDEPAPEGDSFQKEISPGKHAITLRIDTAGHKGGPIRVDIAKAPGSSAEFVVVGGR